MVEIGAPPPGLPTTPGHDVCVCEGGVPARWPNGDVPEGDFYPAEVAAMLSAVLSAVKSRPSPFAAVIVSRVTRTW